MSEQKERYSIQYLEGWWGVRDETTARFAPCSTREPIPEERIDWLKRANGLSYKKSTRDIEDEEARAFLEAVASTLTARAADYPPYSEEASKVARIWNVLKDGDLTAKDVALFMMIVKFVRLGGGTSADSVLDLCGYATRLNGLGRE